MSRSRRKNHRYKTLNDIERIDGVDWYTHYYQYLTSLAFQLFEWKNLPESVDPRYLEMSLHMFGFVGFYKDKTKGFIVSQGAPSGEVDHYLLPTTFHANSPAYQKNFKLYNYDDMLEEAKESGEYGVIIWNNDYHFSTLPSIKMFADELAETQQVIQVNRNAQKTPVIIVANDYNLLTMKNMFNQIDGNSPVIIADESVDVQNSIIVHKTDAPYVVDKLRSDRDKIWNEIMTFLGIKNANLEKKERMITDEANANNEQIESSANIWLKSRKEACKKINDLYNTKIEVELRVDIVQEFQSNLSQQPSNNDEGNDL